jgi:asparagine synthase (glutamine-hydrolysing)
MAHSREIRLPFLDRRVASFALSLPAEYVVRRGLRKAVLRDAVRSVVPAPILDRRDKVGFEPPQARWLSAPPMLALIREVLLCRDARVSRLADLAAIEREAASGAWSAPDALWRVLNAELWLQELHRAAPRMETAA